MFPVSVVIVGAGGRGRGYATYAQKHPDRMKVVAVAEPREWYRQDLAGTYGIPPANVLSDWRQFASRPKLADAAFSFVPAKNALKIDFLPAAAAGKN